MTRSRARARAVQDCVTHGFVVDIDGKKISKSGTYDKPMDAGHFVGRHGADLVRLWASSINYTDDVPFSEEMFTRLGDTYRRIRNTLRILLGNLFDFSVATDAVRGPGSATPATTFALVDRWIMQRLHEVIAASRRRLRRLRIHKVYHALIHFLRRDEQVYIDITKTGCIGDAPTHRTARDANAMHKFSDPLCRLLAPILVFHGVKKRGVLRCGRIDSYTGISELDSTGAT